jgi:hypothetical protein
LIGGKGEQYARTGKLAGDVFMRWRGYKKTDKLAGSGAVAGGAMVA